MYCSKCGNEMPDGAVMCTKCGNLTKEFIDVVGGVPQNVPVDALGSQDAPEGVKNEQVNAQKNEEKRAMSASVACAVASIFASLVTQFFHVYAGHNLLGLIIGCIATVLALILSVVSLVKGYAVYKTYPECKASEIFATWLSFVMMAICIPAIIVMGIDNAYSMLF